ncbi:MAG TPA: amino acid adenylation domain-containing protein [Candidatus Angelobacter sp.]|jgi:amino acid adenylation domain-containing protein|nr:amino acid adenylation domain-containing protein [Candidatus Angelobacter sp.]
MNTNQNHVHHLVSEVARKSASSVAIDAGRKRISYGELEEKAERLAGILRACGILKGSIVGIFSSDPINVVTGILGVLKAGCVFCPLDPTFPEKRLQVMIGSVSPQLFITESKLLDRLSSIAQGIARVLLLDDASIGNHKDVICFADANVPQLAPNPANESGADDPCSIYFTSGSTGKPKAILGRLKGIDHFVRWEAEALGVGAGTRVSQLASPSFDGFLKDVFVPLCAGGVVCAPETRKVVLEPARLMDWVDVEGVEVLHCVPSVLRSLLNQGLDGKYFGELKWVVLAGEALPPADVKRWKEVFGERIGMVNLYGPTETTVTKLCYFVTNEDAERTSIPIGKPIPGAAAMVVNSQGKMCRPGTVGEIYIQTEYRALGYYGEPELTREVFVPNPFSQDPNDIIYKTGDYGRILKDGNIEFLGRRDQQVKVRGVRVELGELENLLRSHAGVKDVAVVDRDDASGNKYLCAYLVVQEGTTTGELRELMVKQVPEFMVPSAFVEMEELPRTLNGKIDRKALPALAEVHKEKKQERARTAVEEIVAGIWSEVLHLPQIGLEENFFELGGHSLLATQIISRIRESLHVELPLRALFENPTVASLARRAEQEGRSEARAEMSPIHPVGRDGNLPLSYSQQRMWLLEQLSSGSAAFNLPMGMRLVGALNVPTLEQTFAEVIRRHEVLRTSFPAHDGQPVQVIGAAGPWKLGIVDLGGLAGDEREAEAKRIASVDAQRPFDLSRGPLVRTVLLKLEEQEHVVICAMHHLVGDAWSFEVLTRELSRLYESYGKGEPSPLPGLAIQYADYAAWQRQWLAGEVLASRLGYWKQQLEGAETELKLPQSRARGVVQSFRGARQGVVLGEELTESLRRLSRKEGTTLYMTLLGAFAVLLYQYTGQEDVVVGSVIANREREEVERLIGFLANTLVLRMDLSGGPSFRELLKRVRESCLGAYGNQLPPEKLMEGLGGEWGAGRGSLFEVWFQMESARREKLELKGLGVEKFEGERGNARFELSLVLEEGEKEVTGEMEYDADLFDDETVSQMIARLKHLLNEMIEHPTSGIESLAVGGEAETEELALAFASALEV